MKHSIIRSLSLYARTRLPSPHFYKPSSELALSTRPRLRFYSTESHSETLETPKDETDDMGNQELKVLIDDYFKGNDKAFPTIFEAVLKRKLSGKHEQSDKQLMEELSRKKQESLSGDEEDEDELEGDGDEEFESDCDEYYGSDEKAAHLNQAMDRLMKEMPIRKMNFDGMME